MTGHLLVCIPFKIVLLLFNVLLVCGTAKTWRLFCFLPLQLLWHGACITKADLYLLWFCLPLKWSEFYSPVTASEAVIPILSQTSPISRTQKWWCRNLGHKWWNLETHYSVMFYTKYYWQHYYLLSSSVIHTCHTHKACAQRARSFTRCSLNNS